VIVVVCDNDLFSCYSVHLSEKDYEDLLLKKQNQPTINDFLMLGCSHLRRVAQFELGHQKEFIGKLVSFTCSQKHLSMFKWWQFCFIFYLC